jgi:hypothetical protein
MTDNKNLQGAQDRARVSAEEPYEVQYFAHKHGISMEKARDIIREHGPSRAACDAAVRHTH